MVRDPRTRSLRVYLNEKKFDLIPLSTVEQLSYASNFLCLKDRTILAVEVEQEIDRVLEGLAAAARRNPHKYATLHDLARRERDELRSGRGFFPHISDVRDRGITVVPLGLREITGGYGGAHCMTCVLQRRSA